MNTPSRNYIIRIFADFATPEGIKESLEKCFCTNIIPYYGTGPGMKVQFTTDNDDYTHAIIINTAMPKLRNGLNKTRVVGLAYEPNHVQPFLNITSEFIKYAKKYIGRYYIGDLKGLEEPFVEGYAYITYSVPKWIYDIKIPHPMPHTNHQLMSIMISGKMYAPGHIYRHRLVRGILQSNLPVDIYGNGCIMYRNSPYANDPRLKGPFAEYEPYENYKFHVAIENFQSNYYFSEKIINPLLSGSIPVYLGCRNISKFFGDTPIVMSGNLEDDMQLIIDIVEHPDKYMRDIDVEKVEERVNLIKNIDELFEYNNNK
jgi:hypothetical protein